jgi:hypothetical protein
VICDLIDDWLICGGLSLCLNYGLFASSELVFELWGLFVWFELVSELWGLFIWPELVFELWGLVV